MSNRVLALIVAGISLSACASAVPDVDADRRKLDQEALGTAYYACLRDAAKDLDDRRSEVLTVALAVKNRCGLRYLAYVEALTPKFTLDGYAEAFKAKMLSSPTQLEDAATAVAHHRLRKPPPMAHPAPKSI